VRSIERGYATQIDQKVARDRGQGFFNGGLMEWVDSRWTSDGEQAAERRGLWMRVQDLEWATEDALKRSEPCNRLY